MAARLAKSSKTVRVPIHMQEAWYKAITKAADAKGISRSLYIATAAHAAAMKDLEKSGK